MRPGRSLRSGVNEFKLLRDDERDIVRLASSRLMPVERASMQITFTRRN
jgi:hypothetical protein